MPDPSRTPLLRSIWLDHILSYGGGSPIELGPLNVLIGTNASGKSNLIEVLALLAEAPRDILKPIREGFGRHAPPRLPQKVDLPEDFLLEDASNLSLVLNNLLSEPKRKQIFLRHLRSLYEEVEEVHTKLQGGTVQVFFHEAGLTHPIPATRLSDGTLRFLCLLTILCHPDPPPVICLEEPEVGLHPDAIATIGELLIEASERTQLIVTTHSDVLVSALSEVPESVIVTERDENGTRLRRLDPEELSEWLDRYRLGELWQMGELGGVRCRRACEGNASVTSPATRRVASRRC